MSTEDIIESLQEGNIVVLPTDTIYGIVGFALNPQTIERIYKLRKRVLDKPMIVLISSLNDLNLFNIKLTKKQKDILRKIWPNPVSVILPAEDERFEYLHKGKNTLAFRMPVNDSLLSLLEKTGPLVAPSANFEGEKAAENIDEAKKYFGDKVSYVDGGTLVSKPSTLIRFSNLSFPPRIAVRGKLRRESNYLWIPDQVGDDKLSIEILREGVLSKEEIKKLLE